jgi:hypothetical protein
MKLVRKSYDPRALATAMMVGFKEWARIDHDDDDNSITLTLARTIGLLERQFGVLIASQTWEWLPRTVSDTTGYADAPENRLCCANGGARVSWFYVPIPLRGITSVTGYRPGMGDITAYFRLAGDSTYSNFAQTYLESLQSDMQVEPEDVFTLATNVVYDIVPFELVDVILRYALFMWENRESATERAMAEVPDWLNRAWAPFWSPRV